MESKIDYVPAHVKDITITLTPDEMLILGAVCGHILGGGPIRRLTTQIYNLASDTHQKIGGLRGGFATHKYVEKISGHLNTGE